MSLDAYLPQDRPVIYRMKEVLKAGDRHIEELKRILWCFHHEKPEVERALKVLDKKGEIVIDRAWVRLVRRDEN